MSHSADPPETTSATFPVEEAAAIRADAPLPFWDEKLDHASEWLNPILIKEARQALKSRQFVITFTFLLFCGLLWTWLGIVLLQPGVAYTEGGVFMLQGYFLILALPVLVVVPFSAFRSLAAEREDGTYQLISITTLPARQIVTGKLGSAMLQLLIYYSALAPCIVFTYLLRGVDIPTILIVVGLNGFISIFLSSFGLVVATWARVRHWQVALSVMLIILLLVAGLIWTVVVYNLILGTFNIIWDDAGTWVQFMAIAIHIVSWCVLFVTMAASNASFVSDNRSTAIRYVAIGQQVIWTAWMSYSWLNSRDATWLLVMQCGAVGYWTFLGSLLIGESGLLSSRVRRSLPQSFLGRLFLTWFNPGSGTGYFFTVANLAAVMVGTIVMMMASPSSSSASAPDDPLILLVTCVTTAYALFYLGLARLVLLALRKLAPFGPGSAFILTLLLAILGCLFPFVFGGLIGGFASQDYSLLQVTNWWWTLAEIADDDPIAIQLSLPIIVGLTCLVMLMNMVQASEEIGLVRVATPARVLAEQTRPRQKEEV